MADLSLINAGGPDDVVAYCSGKPVRVPDFLQDLGALQSRLPERKYVLNLCSNRYHFAVAFCAAVLRGQVNLLPPTLTPFVIGQIKDSFPDVYCIADEAEAQYGIDAYAFQELRTRGGSLDGIPAIPDARQAAIVFTSGSTGMPTPNHKSWGSLARSALAEVESLGLRAKRGMALLGTVPPQHMYGLESTVFLAMQGRLPLHSGRPFFPLDICVELAALPRPRGLVTTPVHLQALLGGMNEFPPLDFLLCATAPLAPDLAAEAEARLGAPLHEIYGCTEAGHIATRRPTASSHWILAPGLSLRQDSEGTWVAGGHVESEVLLGDVIEVLSEGVFRLHGRDVDLVNIAGKRTSLAYLDHHLRSIDGVVDGAFVMPGRRHGAVPRLMAFAVAPGLTKDGLMSMLRQRIDPAFLPRPLCLVESLPRNETGKLPRFVLEELTARFLRS